MKLMIEVSSVLLIKWPITADSKSPMIITVKVVEAFFVLCMIFEKMKPTIPPITTGKNTNDMIRKIGISTVEIRADTNAMTKKKTKAPTRSSNAAIGINVRVTGPSVLRLSTTEREGAGAVASAIPPKMNAR